MKHFLHNFKIKLSLLAVLLTGFLAGQVANAQTELGSITVASASCDISFDICNGDTIRLAPTNTAGFTNFTWYYDSEIPANIISGANASQGVISVSNDTLIVAGLSTSHTYILTGNYASPSGCAALNDTITLDFQNIPDLATTPDTICTAGSETSDLTSLVSDANGASGTPTWYPTLADAQSESNALVSTSVSPSASTKYYVRQTTTGTAGCYDIDSVMVVVSCMELGNLVWYDNNNDGVYNSGSESPIAGVEVELFHDANGDGSLTAAEQTSIAKDTTNASGLYLFTNLPEGDYFVGIPSSEFGSSEPLEYLYSSQTTIANDGTVSETTADDADTDNGDTDDNGTAQTSGFYNGGVLTAQVTLSYEDEPTGETPDNGSVADNNDNLAVDFGFYGMSIGSLVYNDIDNNGTFAGSDTPISGATVKLYSQDSTTVIATTQTDVNGKYLFTNLVEGTYFVAVVTPAGTLSSDDIATSATPNSTDNDDNGTVSGPTETRSPEFVLDAGTAPTGESDHGDTMGNPAVTDNAGTPDNNSNLHVDFGFKPVCVVISNPSAAQAICAGDTGTDITVDVSSSDSIRFVRFSTAQAGSAMYTGGTGLDSVDVVGGTATLTFVTDSFPNTGTSPVTYYVYGILKNTPADPTCRPVQEIQVTVNPNPTATNASLTACETSVLGGTYNFGLADANADVLNGQTGMTVTYHLSSTAAMNGTGAIDSLSANNATTVYARVETGANCYATSEVTLNVNPRPSFTLSLPTTCPGDNPTVLITLGTGADANPNVSVDGDTPFAFNSLIGGVLETGNGITLGASNTVQIVNGTGCDANQSIIVPNIITPVCLPVKIEKLND